LKQTKFKAKIYTRIVSTNFEKRGLTFVSDS